VLGAAKQMERESLTFLVVVKEKEGVPDEVRPPILRYIYLAICLSIYLTIHVCMHAYTHIYIHIYTLSI